MDQSPPNLCSFEEERWRSPRNVLSVVADHVLLRADHVCRSAIANYTERIADRADDKSACVVLVWICCRACARLAFSADLAGRHRGAPG